MKIALIGYGGIGSLVAAELARDRDIEIVAVAARAHQANAMRACLGDVRLVDSARDLIASGPQLVVECASHGAFRQYAETVLAAGLDLIAVSVGVLAEAPYRTRVLQAAEHAGVTLEIPAGAIGAVDVIAAAKIAGLDKVTYITRKTPNVWRNTPAEKMIDLAAVTEPALFFDDTAERAALLFTEKANVCSTLALAGIGFEKTRAHFWADPAVTSSVHEIEAAGACGTLKLDLGNTVSPLNGKASWLTAMSIVRAVRNRTATLRI